MATAEQVEALSTAIAQNTAFLKTLMDKLQVGGSSQPVKTEAGSSKEFIMESLANSILEFSYDPENGITFDSWYSRYKDLFDLDCKNLVEGEKVRLLLRKLNTIEHEKYVNFILPKQPREIKFDATIENLSKLFGRQVSLFNLRYRCLQSSKLSQDDFVSYASKINKSCEDFKLNTLTSDQFKCLIFIIGLRSQEDADIRTKLLGKLEAEKDTINLGKMVTECEQLRNLKSDAALVEGDSKFVNFVGKNKHKNNKKVHKKLPPKADSSTKSNTNSKSPLYPCWQCGAMHYVQQCEFSNHKCQQCNKIGHKEGYCNCIRKSNKSKKFKDSNASTNVINVNNVSTQSKRKYVTVNINNVPVKLQIDTASDITIISRDTWEKIHKPSITNSSQIAKDASSNCIKFLGEFECSISFQHSTHNGKCFVSANSNINLMGIDFIEKFNFWDRPLNTICNSIELKDKPEIINDFKSKFPSLFSGKLGKCINKVKLSIKPNSIPVFCPRRPVAFSMIEKVDEALNRMKNEGILTPVNYSRWAAPIVCVRKPNGDIRICTDYSTGVNECLEDHNYPLPSPDEIYVELSGNSIFTHIDLNDAYFQAELEDDSKEFLTITTHQGLFQINRLPQGVKPASKIFQQLLDTLFAGLKGVKVFIDDIVVASKDLKSHIRLLKEVFRRLQAHGFTLKLETGTFFKKESII